MKAVDTNVLVRAILKDDETLSLTASKTIQDIIESTGLLITIGVAMELAFILGRKMTSGEVVKVFESFLNNPGVHFSNRKVVVDAVESVKTDTKTFGVDPGDLKTAILIKEAVAGGASHVSFLGRLKETDFL